MRPGRGILDTSVVILLDQMDESADLPEEPLLSVVALAELSVGPLVAAAGARERATRQARLQVTESSFDPLPFDAASARAFGEVTAQFRKRGRRRRERSSDVMIAATAKARGLPVFTANPEDSVGIEGLDVIAIHPA
jgi:hypothetical protein